MNAPHEAQSLSRMFETTIHLVGATWKRNLRFLLMIWLPGAIPSGILYFFAARKAAAIVTLLEAGPANAYPSFGELLPLGVLMLAASVCAVLSALFAGAAMKIANASEVEGAPLDWREVVGMLAKGRALRLLGAELLFSVVFGVLFGLPALLFIASIPPALLLVPWFFIALPMAQYLSIRWMFVRIAVAWENCSLGEAFSRSTRLVAERWWRTFGIATLFSISVMAAVWCINTPLGLLLSYIGVQDNVALFPDPVFSRASFFRVFLRSISAQAPVTTTIAAVAGLLTSTAYNVVMYFDLRARRGEFGDADSVPATPRSHSVFDGAQPLR